jgi:hypothetical protein
MTIPEGVSARGFLSPPMGEVPFQRTDEIRTTPGISFPSSAPSLAGLWKGEETPALLLVLKTSL